MARFIFITGGVVSSLGKGLMAASPRGAAPGARLQGPHPQVRSLSQRRSGDDVALSAWRGLRHRRRRRDRSRPRPLRALHRRCRRASSDNVTSGRIYQRHHRRASGAATISARPSRSSRTSPTRSRNSRCAETDDLDFVLCEIGGTVGDIESLPFIEAIRQLRNELGREQTVLVHTTLVPYIAAAGELKTKPTQHIGARADQPRRPARRPAVPLRAAAARERARQDRAVLQRAGRKR